MWSIVRGWYVGEQEGIHGRNKVLPSRSPYHVALHLNEMQGRGRLRCRMMGRRSCHDVPILESDCRLTANLLACLSRSKLERCFKDGDIACLYFERAQPMGWRLIKMVPTKVPFLTQNVPKTYKASLSTRWQTAFFTYLLSIASFCSGKGSFLNRCSFQ